MMHLKLHSNQKCPFKMGKKLFDVNPGANPTTSEFTIITPALQYAS
jgi:hypothetical protein